MKMNEVNLPNGWAIATVGELADYVNGRAFKPTEWKDNGKPIIRIQNLNDDHAKYNYSSENHEEKYVVKNGDLLFAWSASLGAHLWHGGDAWLNQHIFNVHPNRSTTKLFVYYLLKKITIELYAKTHGSGMVHVTKGKFESTEILLPPLPEQKRIVAKIEELFSELDKGIESFKTAREQLKVYRQALLKHAIEGKLTATWREENKDKLETAAALLKRIQAERAERYRQQVKEWEKAVKAWEKNGKQGSKPGKPSQPKQLPPLTAEELAELPQLPEGWGWCKYGDLCSIVKNGISEKPVGVNGTKIFRISAVRPMFFDMDDFRFIDSTDRFDGYYLAQGDLVFTRYNGSRRYVGVCARYKSDEKRLFPDKLIQTRIFPAQLLDPSYLEKAVNCGGSRKFIESKIRTTAGQSGVSGEDIKNTPVPICSPTEQSLIVADLESKLSEIDNLDQTITTALQQAETLRQSILKKAFSGQLVAQDTNDEPAAKLLARIKAERDTQNKGDIGKKRTITRKKKTAKV